MPCTIVSYVTETFFVSRSRCSAPRVSCAQRARGVAECRFEALLHVPGGLVAPRASVAAVAAHQTSAELRDRVRARLLTCTAVGDQVCT